MTRLVASGLTDRGRLRLRNEDAWYADPATGLFVVADGMGGHPAGEVAARMAVEMSPVVLARCPADEGAAARDCVAAGIAEMNRRLHEAGVEEPGRQGMGTTLVVALLRAGSALVAHLGDSRAYRLRGGRLERLTRDHSLVEELVESGRLPPEAARTHPARPVLTRALGVDATALPEIESFPLAAGDRWLLCSDGLLTLTEPQIAGLLGAAEEPAAACRALIDEANRAGGDDNITAVVIEVLAP